MESNEQASLIKYLEELAQTHKFKIFTRKGPNIHKYLCHYKNAYVPPVKDEQGNIIKKASCRTAFKKNVAFIDVNSNQLTFYKDFLQEHPALVGQTLYVLGTKVVTYEQYVKGHKNETVKQSIEKAARERLPEDSNCRSFGGTIAAYWLMKQLNFAQALKKTFPGSASHIYLSLLQYMFLNNGRSLSGYQSFAAQNMIFGCSRWSAKDIASALSKLTPAKISKFWEHLAQLAHKPNDTLVFCLDALPPACCSPQSLFNSPESEAKLLCAFNAHSSELFYSEVQASSTPDLQSFKAHVSDITQGAAATFKTVLFRGTDQAIATSSAEQSACSKDFIQVVTPENNPFKDKMPNRLLTIGTLKNMVKKGLYGVCMGSVDTEQGKVFYHLYKDVLGAEEELNVLSDMLDEFEGYQHQPIPSALREQVAPFLTVVDGVETINQYKVENAALLAGTTVLCTTLDVPSSQLYATYRDHSFLQACFKRFLDSDDALNYQADEKAYEGYLLLATLASCMLMMLHRMLSNCRRYDEEFEDIIPTLQQLALLETDTLTKLYRPTEDIFELMKDIGLDLKTQAKALDIEL